MTHVVREVNRMGSKLNNKETVEAVTVIETPPMVAVGLVGYTATPNGPRPFKKIWAKHVSEGFKRRIVRNWYKTKKTSAYSKLVERYGSKESIDKAKELIIKYCDVVRIVCHTPMVENQVRKLPGVQMKKDPIMEFQINGGTVAEKIDFGLSKFEQQIHISEVFSQNELIDVIGITKGKGFKGVTSRWHTKKLPRKTHKGLRKVACIGAWHPARVSFTVARAGLKQDLARSGMTESDITDKSINPMGGFPNYGYVKNDFLIIRGCCLGPYRRMLTLRKSLNRTTTRVRNEVIDLKLIDTSSKHGCGRFQTTQEKKAHMGLLKKDKTVKA